MPERPKVYSEQEASEIVRRAAELAEAKASNAYRSGITRDELERIASEMGVPLDALDQAISESHEPEKTKRRFAFNTKVESVLDFEANEEDLGTILDKVHSMRRHAVVLTSKRLDMVSMCGTMRTRITAVSKNGRTRLTLDGKGLTVFMLSAYPILIFGFTFIARMSQFGFGAAILGAAALVSLALAAFWVGMQFSVKRLHALADEIKETLEENHRQSADVRRELEKPVASKEGTAPESLEVSE